MAQEAMKRFLGRLITDDEFRRAVQKDFDKAYFSEGFILSDSER